MPPSTNFEQWNPGAVNQENDVQYAADPLRSGGAVGGAFPAISGNKLYYQLGIFVKAFADMLVDKTYSPNDGSANPSTALTDLKGVLANVVTQVDLATFQAALLSGFATDFSGTDGYIKLPAILGGFIIQWAQGASDNSEGPRTITLPLVFPTACLMAQVSYKTTASAANDAWYQITAISTTTVTVYRQTTGGSTQSSNAFVLAVGH